MAEFDTDFVLTHICCQQNLYEHVQYVIYLCTGLQ